MSTRKTSAGDIIEAHCTRCRTTLNHTVVAMVEDRIVRVQCNTCGGIHNYRQSAADKATATASPVAPKKAGATSRKVRTNPEELALQEWESIRETVEKAEPLPYDMSRQYRTKAIIDHPVFGRGMVKQVLPQKIEVTFRSGTKLLRCR